MRRTGPPRIAVLAHVILVLAVLLVAAPPLAAPSAADPPPGRDLRHSARLAGGWMARQVTADGAAVGTDPATDLAPTAWTVLATLATGEGRNAVLRGVQRLVIEVDDRGAEDLAVDELALVALVLSTAGGDPRVVGDTGHDLIAELTARQQPTGVDEGRIGVTAPLATPVRDHALAVAALVAAGATPTTAQIRWLREQQCPGGGWPEYRDAAARRTGTCELLAPATAPTAFAVQTLAAVGGTPIADPRPFLRAARDDGGGFAPAPGLSPTPAATAHGVLAVIALTGGPPDSSWAGERGLPQEVLRQEQLGCGWHGLDRGAVPRRLRQDEPAAADDPGADPPEPGAAARVADVAVAALALSGLPLPVGRADPVVGDPFPECPVTARRAAGPARVDTALALSSATFVHGAETAVVATASGYADALAATGLAGALAAPVLLTPPDRVPASVTAEIARLGAAEVVLMGGEAALSGAVEVELAAIDGVQRVRRIAGATRFETAVAAAEEIGGARAFLARGSGPEPSSPWADALSVGAWAAATATPVLLTAADTLPGATARAIADREEITIIGGESAVSAEVAARSRDLGPSVLRVGGATRVATSAAVMAAAFADGVDARVVGLATAADYPDALAAGPALAAAGGTLLLVDPAHGAAPGPTREALLSVDYLVDVLLAVGGPSAVDEEVLASAAQAVREGADP